MREDLTGGKRALEDKRAAVAKIERRERLAKRPSRTTPDGSGRGDLRAFAWALAVGGLILLVVVSLTTCTASVGFTVVLAAMPAIALGIAVATADKVTPVRLLAGLVIAAAATPALLVVAGAVMVLHCPL